MDKIFDKLIEDLKEHKFNVFAFMVGCRETFELIYTYRNELKKEFIDKSEMIDEICNTKSEQDFLRVLRKYQTEEDKKEISVEEIKNGILYLV